jgi:hypothetical protein
MTYRKLSRVERMFQKFRNWCYQTTDEKVLASMILFLVVVTLYFYGKL